MNFLTRLGYFAFGLGLGCLLVYVMLIRNRTDLPAWLPGDRVIQDLAVDSVIIDTDIILPFPDSLLIARIKASDVKFDESIVRDVDCKEYQLQSKEERMRFRQCRTEIRLIGYEALR